ncbi:MAG: hypothetical protein HGB37_00905 [Candidatus Moranbacteria bacterium]|nr:hypothetical protein [Candidatus Moranbacteria bacterium]
MPQKKKTNAISAEAPLESETEPKKTLATMKTFQKNESVQVAPVAVKTKPGIKITKVSDSGKTSRKDKTGMTMWFVGAVLLLAALGAAIYFYIAYRQAIEARPAESEVGQLIARISRFMELPAGETPTLATVTDKGKLSGQDFFAIAENGDKVLIYEKAAKAVLFRPSTGRVMNVAPINTSAETEKTSAEPATQTLAESPSENVTPTEPATTDGAAAAQIQSAPVGKAKVALYNGSTTVGITTKVEKELATGLADSVEVVAKDAASKKDYEGVTVVDLSGARSQDASSIAGLLGGAVATALPDSEATPEGADIVVIIGNVKK